MTGARRRKPPRYSADAFTTAQPESPRGRVGLGLSVVAPAAGELGPQGL
jgi:hypothetical protein